LSVELLTPTGLAVAVAAAVPLALLALAERRGDRARSALGLSPRRSRGLVVPGIAIAVVAVLAGVAAAQPVLRARADEPVRTDAAAFVVVDTSRSMLAATSPTSPTRLDRARRAAFEVRDRLEGIPVGIASMSDRVLPHLFPTPDRSAFAATLLRSLGGGRPAPAGAGESGTNLTALAAIPTQNFFAPTVRRRVVVVITDAESAPIEATLLDRSYRAQPRTALVLLRLGGPGETVWDARGRAEAAYGWDPAAPFIARETAAATAGRLAANAGEAGELATQILGSEGPTEARPGQERRTALAPYAVLLAAVPLGLLLRRRNMG
jgi:von Willebrand factor type A domain